ncbi:transporter substrate-binding domain-containing protein [Candidatus Phytoplasma solani]|uniref:transporter substrate-binding domain-containing protein n=1 Tax=Candidatus Phytoplasma solani TaxID=69896 RepID=UPI0032DA3B58
MFVKRSKKISNKKCLKVGIINTLGLPGFDSTDRYPLIAITTTNGGKISGTDALLFKALVDKMDVDLEVTTVDKDGMWTSLNNGVYDVVSSTYNYTEERAHTYDVEKNVYSKSEVVD